MADEISSVFMFNDYKAFLSKLVVGEKNWGMLSKIADAAQCQKSYLSRVIHKEIHLTPEQAFRISRYLQQDTLEQEYFGSLVEHDRSGDRDHKQYISNRILNLKSHFEKKSKEANKKTPLENLNMSFYYTRIE